MTLHHSIYEAFQKDIKRKAIEKREACHHWINFEIFDFLPENLQEKYLEHFEFPFIIYGFDDKSLKVLCRANHFDKPNECRCDCSEKYSETIKFIRENFFLEKSTSKDEDNSYLK